MIVRHDVSGVRSFSSRPVRLAGYVVSLGLRQQHAIEEDVFGRETCLLWRLRRPNAQGDLLSELRVHTAPFPRVGS